MSLELRSPCKVNLLLNILGRRPDGFHELETLMHPVALFDDLAFQTAGSGIELTCSDSSLPVDASNLVHKAASHFLKAAGVSDGVRIHLTKNVPAAAGLGGGSGNAAITLEGLNQLFGQPLDLPTLLAIAAELGSDVPFFLKDGPALCTGRGEKIEPLDPFPALQGRALLLIRPDFGVSTAWAYRELGRYQDALNGSPGRASRLAQHLRGNDLSAAADSFFNSLEQPVFGKFPWLALLKEELISQGAAVALMSGSGSTTFAIVDSTSIAESLREHALKRYGSTCWSQVVEL
jgi:4-diphosphocytidyl-2-C-methyl-D-erythritol kinase